MDFVNFGMGLNCNKLRLKSYFLSNTQTKSK